MPCSETSRPGRLDVLLDADAPESLHRPEASERGAEREHADRDEAERLDAELVEAARVDEPAGAGREVRCERRHREEARRERPPDARPCRAPRPRRSGRRCRSARPRARRRPRSTPATTPITTAAHGATKPDAAVIATSAAITPFSIIDTSGFLSTIHACADPAERAGRGGEVRRQRDVGEVAELVAGDDAAASSRG